MYPDVTAQDVLERHMNRWKGQSLIDYAFHINFLVGTPISAVDQVSELVESRIAE